MFYISYNYFHHYRHTWTILGSSWPYLIHYQSGSSVIIPYHQATTNMHGVASHSYISHILIIFICHHVTHTLRLFIYVGLFYHFSLLSLYPHCPFQSYLYGRGPVIIYSLLHDSLPCCGPITLASRYVHLISFPILPTPLMSTIHIYSLSTYLLILISINFLHVNDKPSVGKRLGLTHWCVLVYNWCLRCTCLLGFQ